MGVVTLDNDTPDAVADLASAREARGETNGEVGRHSGGSPIRQLRV